MYYTINCQCYIKQKKISVMLSFLVSHYRKRTKGLNGLGHKMMISLESQGLKDIKLQPLAVLLLVLAY